MQRRGGGLQDVLTLFDSGTTVGMTDGELLGRFAERPDRIGDGPDAAGPAFAALVQRHGPMVLRVCRSILRDAHDAQDAFQATFLVLVRRARAVRRQGSVASWLHGVALRGSARARGDLARRRRHERRAGEARIAANRSDNGESLPETAAILHEELGRLPERYRRAVVLCYLEGYTCEAAARRLGWPVGTVKSRLARGRERLRGRLTRRGLAPDEASSLPAPGVISAPLARDTIQGMLRFAGWPTAGATSATALSWTYRTLRTMQMTRLAMLSALLIAGLAVTGAAMWTTQDQTPAETRSAASSKAARDPEPAKPAAPERKIEQFSVRVIDTKGRGVPGVEVKVLEEDAASAGDGPGYRTAAYRTGADGRFRITADARFRRLSFQARPDDRTLGWASLRSGEAWPKATDDDPITLTLLSRNHQVEGTIVDTRGKPIRDVQVRAVQFDHDINGFATDYPQGDEKPSLASTVTDEMGRYRLSLPEGTTVIFLAYHSRFVGDSFHCKPDGRTIAPAILEDAGGLAGTVVDAATGQPVAGAKVSAQRIEHDRRLLGGGWGATVSDAQGRFRIGGLAPGVYNLLFASSPKGRRFTARAVEGVRVKAGEEARADLRMIEGRRLHGTAVVAETGKPLVGQNILCYNASHPRSGAACQGTFTDDQGRFEHFVPPGPAFVYINAAVLGQEHQKTLIVPDGRDPDSIILKRTDDPNAKPFRQPFSPLVKCEVRVRVKTDPGDRSAPGKDRVLTGRVFAKNGTPLPAIQVFHNSRTLTEGATDRLGLFRLKGLPQGRLRLGLRRNGEHDGEATIPAGADEIDLIFP